MAEVLLHNAEEGIPLAEAAFRLGISERTLRKRIKAGTIKAVKVITPNGGAALRVFLGGAANEGNGSEPLRLQSFHQAEAGFRPMDPSFPPASESLPHTSESSLGELVRHIATLEQQNLELAGRVGFYQSEIQHLQAQVRELEQENRLLKAPVGAEDRAAGTSSHPTHVENGADSASQKVFPRPWWQFWRSG